MGSVCCCVSSPMPMRNFLWTLVNIQTVNVQWICRRRDSLWLRSRRRVNLRRLSAVDHRTSVIGSGQRYRWFQRPAVVLRRLRTPSSQTIQGFRFIIQNPLFHRRADLKGLGRKWAGLIYPHACNSSLKSKIYRALCDQVHRPGPKCTRVCKKLIENFLLTILTGLVETCVSWLECRNCRIKPKKEDKHI